MQFSSALQTPDRIGMQILTDRSILRVLVWDATGAQHYPPRQGIAPSLYDFSEEMVHRLKRIHGAVAGYGWSRLDATETELLFCNEAPAVCVIYDHVQLENTLRLPPGALQPSTVHPRPIALVLTLLACLFGVCAIWFRDRDGKMNTELTIMPEHHIAKRGPLEVSLTPRDMKLLSLLQERDGAVVTKDELYDVGWGREYMPNSRALDQHIINLRRKLDPQGTLPVIIETVRGVGYRLSR